MPMATDWCVLKDRKELGKITEVEIYWGNTLYSILLPREDVVVRTQHDELASLDAASTGIEDSVAYVTAAAQVANALTQDVLLAPIESSIIPLPHQIQVLSQAISGDHVRYLLANEVRLGRPLKPVL